MSNKYAAMLALNQTAMLVEYVIGRSSFSADLTAHVSQYIYYIFLSSLLVACSSLLP